MLPVVNNVNNRNQRGQGPRAAPFDGFDLTRINENATIGPKATNYLSSTRYPHLSKQGTDKFNLSGTKHHEHGYGYWLRKIAQQTIYNSVHKDDSMIDIGASAIRNANSTSEFGGQQVPWSHRTHSICPIIDMRDYHRHATWKQSLESAGKQFPIQNQCGRAVDGTLCACINNLTQRPWRDTAIYTSIDSAYYPHVLETIENEMLQRKTLNPNILDVDSKFSYITIHDYHQAYKSGVLQYECFDGEATVQFDENHKQLQVLVHSRGNPTPYKHGVVNTGPSTGPWGRKRTLQGQDFTVLYEPMQRWKYGDHDYVLIRIAAVPGVDENLPYVDTYFVDTGDADKHQDNLIEGITLVIQPHLKIAQSVIDGCRGILRTFAAVVKKGVYDKIVAEVQLDGSMKISLEYTDNNHKLICEKMDVFPNEVGQVYQSLIGNFTNIAATRAYKQLVADRLKQHPDQVDFTKQVDACKLAQIMVSKDMRKIYDINNTSFDVALVRAAMQGTTVDMGFVYQWLMNIQRFFARTRYITMLIGFIIGFMCMLPKVYADDGTLYSNSYFDLLIMYVGFMVLTSLGKTILERRSYMGWIEFDKRKWLKGTCVLDVERLNLATTYNRRYDARFKFRNPDWDITGLSGQQAFDKLPCCKEKSEAAQIGPLFQGFTSYEPCVKHVCPRTEMAASIRACQSSLRPDPVIFSLFANQLEIVFSEILKGIEQEGCFNVDLDAWMLKYPESYREKLVKEIETNPELFVNVKCYGYDAFPKRELNYCDVPSDLKNTSVNTVKERQICGPPNAKKVAANAFCYELERFCDKYVKDYCGRANWEQICSKIEEGTTEIHNVLFAATDGSGFDMNVSEKFHLAFEKGVERILQSPHITIDHRLRKSDILLAFVLSRTAKISVARGECVYFNDGRQSGDGWTTVANTMINVAINRTVFELANIPRKQRFVICKGDDTLACINSDYKDSYEKALEVVYAKNKEVVEHGVGMIMKFCKFGDIEDMDFISCNFIKCGDHLRMIRVPGRVTQTLGWSTKITPEMRNPDKLALELLYSKGMCTLAWAKGLPLFEHMATMCVRLGKEGPNTEYDSYKDEARVWDKSGDEDTLFFIDWMNRKYGITQQDMDEVISLFDTVQDSLVTINHPLFDKIYQPIG